jgi:hypothetical protein
MLLLRPKDEDLLAATTSKNKPTMSAAPKVTPRGAASRYINTAAVKDYAKSSTYRRVVCLRELKVTPAPDP